MKFNDDLTNTKPSLRRLLTDDEIKLFEWRFKMLAGTALPDKIFDDMMNIEVQFQRDKKLSDAQMDYVNDIYERYT